MKKDNMRAAALFAVLAVACVCMAVVDAVLQPGYVIKSLIKMAAFLLLPLAYSLYDKSLSLKEMLKPRKNGLFIAVGVGLAFYLIVFGAYFVFRNVFDFSSMTKSITSSTGVNKDNFLFVAIYISFANSFLEEFFFRGFAFLHMKKVVNKRWAYIVSAGAFALYHIAMMIGWFNGAVVALCMVGLFIGGIIFNRFAEWQDNIYLSWLIHMFANFATNTIGFIEFLNA